MTFKQILSNYREIAFSERDKGDKFERLMATYLQTDPTYASKFKTVWLWNEFPAKKDLGGTDTGIDLVALTHDGEYWAIQCKCYQEGSIIDKKSVDSFLSTSSRQFKGVDLKTTSFAHRLWIDTTGRRWGKNAEQAVRNQMPPLTRIGLYQLEEAPVKWDIIEAGQSGESARKEKYEVRPHQKVARDKTNNHFKEHDRGKLIMACGTGKTFTSLRIAEKETGGNGLVLFLVPSIALLGQTLREWSAQSINPINAVCICSDPAVSRKKKKDADVDFFSTIDLALPASTDTDNIVRQFRHIAQYGNDGMTVVFSTYQSIEVIARAQKALAKENDKYGQFDIIICDEAHRTTGVKLTTEDESSFVRVHDNKFIKGNKRLYMTATPRLYASEAKSRAAREDATLWSMDEVEFYGEEIHRIGFGEAVGLDLLTDYKVLILTLSENDVPPSIQRMISNDEYEINSDDASKLIGCINALSKQIIGDEGSITETDPEPMKRALAFCPKIIASKKVTDIFNTTSDEYISSLPEDKRIKMTTVASKHIDGTMSAPERDELIGWLKEDSNDCRVLTNVRCLSEGVDVPSLDAVMFLSARNSQIDVVQSVGRVMRKAPNKKYGYIIIPVLVPSDIEADKALDDNKRFAVVWTVLNALRAHDDRFNATVNQIELNKKKPESIIVGTTETGFDSEGNPIKKDSDKEDNSRQNISQQLALQFEDLQSVMFARMVKKVGDRRYWEQWAKSVAEIAERQIIRITKLIDEDEVHQQSFQNFLSGLKKNINPSISTKEAIEMLSQHIITKPVFEALFEGYSFVDNNAISISMQLMLSLLEEGALDEDTETLNKFYNSVRIRAKGIDNAEGRQRIIIELYDKFFSTAFPKMVEKLGIVYTPVEVVDFIIHSVNDVLKQEFGRSVSDENVHVLDPFTGTGTFITRLLQSGLIQQKDLARKYKYELHANEIVLLAYYIAAVNIENTYHDIQKKIDGYESFDGICLTDTFQLGESDNSDELFSEMFPSNSQRVQKQVKAPITVIVGNPPYSAGQKSENDSAQNQSYENLESRISDTYAKASLAANKNALYDSYLKAYRWSTDRLNKDGGGVIAFVSNGAWLDGNSQSGFRKVIENEFSIIYVFNLRGNQRTSGELSRKEGGKIFGSGSRTPISITILVKKTQKDNNAKILYYDIGNYLNRVEKLKIITNFKSIKSIPFERIIPNEDGDWINQRKDLFKTFIKLNPHKKFNTTSDSFFILNSMGISTNRDAWAYNFSKNTLKEKMYDMVMFYNDQVDRFKERIKEDSKVDIKKFINRDSSKISWSSSLIPKLEKGLKAKFEGEKIFTASYRPFTKQFLYYGEKMIHRRSQTDSIFPQPYLNDNLIICISSNSNDGSVIITNRIADLHLNGDVQAFPLYYFEKNQEKKVSLFDDTPEEEFIPKSTISDYILDLSILKYGNSVNKTDIFFYVYGFLHSDIYKKEFVNDLKKTLPRLPLVDSPKNFWAFSKAGRALTDLHINYEEVDAFSDSVVMIDRAPANQLEVELNSGQTKVVNYRVTKMKFPKKGQKDSIIYNSQITIENIPAKAYKYVVNGKSAIEWIMERYQVKTDKKSGITNDPNDWSDEVGNPRYIFDLLLSIINVSVQTVDIVESLPKLKFE